MISDTTNRDDTLNNATPSAISREVGLVMLSDELIRDLELYLLIPIHSITCAVGVVTNILNMTILFKLEIKNSIGVGGFALSLTDFLVTCVQLAMCCCYLLMFVYPGSEVDMWMLGVFAFGWIRYTGFFLSSWITTAISVERCFCVVSPFMVKRIFTKTRCIVVIVMIYAVHIALIVPIYVFEKITWKDVAVPRLNFTSTQRILTVEFPEDAPWLEFIVDTISGISLSLLSQFILIVSTAWMILALRESSRVRRTGDSNAHSVAKKSFQATALSSRELRLVKVVVYLAVVLTVCNVPRYVVMAVNHILRGLNSEVNKNLSGLMWDVTAFFGTVNCSSNFLVYWKLNGNFRSCFWKLLGRDEETGAKLSRICQPRVDLNLSAPPSIKAFLPN